METTYPQPPSLAVAESPAIHPAAVIERWHIWRGTVRYFLVGPGPQAMHPCSEPDYVSHRPTMTPKESAIAKAALALLEQRHRYDKEAGVKEIKLALAQAARGVRPQAAGEIRPTIETDGEFHPQKAAAPVKITKEMTDRVARFVGLVCNVPAHRLYQKLTSIAALREARILFIGSIRDLHPGIMQKDLMPILDMSPASISQALMRHGYNLDSFKDYKRKHEEVLRLAGAKPNSKAS